MLYAIPNSRSPLAIMPASEENPDPWPDIDDSETVDAEVVNAEIVDAEVVEPAANPVGTADVADAEVADAEVADVEIAGDAVTGAEVVKPKTPNYELAVDLSVQRLSAKGGAVGSVLLSVFGLAGMAFSSYSVINVLLAFLFAFWGLQSPLRSIAKLGLGLAGLGLIVFIATLQ